MTVVFLWTGFICSILIVLALTAFIVIYLIDYVVNKTIVLNKVYKLIITFYNTFPRKKMGYRYMTVLYDYDQKKFIDSKYSNEPWSEISN